MVRLNLGEEFKEFIPKSNKIMRFTVRMRYQIYLHLKFGSIKHKTRIQDMIEEAVAYYYNIPTVKK